MMMRAGGRGRLHYTAIQPHHAEFSPSLCFLHFDVICFPCSCTRMRLVRWSSGHGACPCCVPYLRCVCRATLPVLRTDCVSVYEDAGLQVAGAMTCVMRHRSRDDRSSKEPEWPPVST